MLGHSSIVLTAGTYISVVPELARAFRRPQDMAAPVAPGWPQRGPTYDQQSSTRRENRQVSTGAPPGTRTPNPRIKSSGFASACYQIMPGGAVLAATPPVRCRLVPEPGLQGILESLLAGS